MRFCFLRFFAELIDQWKIVRMGADIKIKCLGCNAIVMFSRRDFEKRLKKVVEHVE